MTNKQYHDLLSFMKQNVLSVGTTDEGTMYEMYEQQTDTEVIVLCARNHDIKNRIIINYTIFIDGDIADACQIDLLRGPQTQAEKRVFSFVKECSKRLITQETMAQKTGFLRSFDSNQH